MEVAALPGSLGLSVMGRPSAGKGRRTSSPSGSAPPKIFCFLPCPRSLYDPSEPLHGEAKNAPRRSDARGSPPLMNATDATTPITHAANAGDVTAIFCPECGDDVEDVAPENYLVPGVRPGYRHVSDRTALCPVMTAAGYRPAEPVEHQAGA